MDLPIATLGANVNRFEPAGKLTLTVDIEALANAEPGTELSNERVYVRGFEFTLNVKVGKGHCLQLALDCDMFNFVKWSCLALVKLRIKSVSQAEEEYKFTHRFCTDEHETVESVEKWTSEFLTDPANELYDAEKNTMVLEAEITVDPAVGWNNNTKSSDVIQVQNKTVEINKFRLAFYSEYFRSTLFGTDSKLTVTNSIQLEQTVEVEHFHRLLDTLDPVNIPLDDECIEGVLQLANKFGFTIVEGKCLDFLLTKSKKSALSKLRFADAFVYPALKEHALNALKNEGFGEYFKLSDVAKDLLKERFTD